MMKMDRKWIILCALLALVLATGCGKKPAPKTTPPPTAAVTPPPADVDSTARPSEAMDETEQQPPQSIQELQDEMNRLGLLGDVYYDFDQYDLRSDSKERLARNAEFIKSDRGRDLLFTVEGHCDNRGTNEYNIALGQKRSTAAVDYLVSLGVDSGRFKTISYGEEKPFCTEDTEACWQQNRRARFVITGRQ